MAQSRTADRTHPRRHSEGEQHLNTRDTIRDIVIGTADGLTVPFALAAGITSAIAASHIVVMAGVAEIAAGGISMGLGGYLAARTEHEHYQREERREIDETVTLPEEERREIEGIFNSYGITGEALANLTDAITSNQQRWVDFMMRFELGLEQPNPHKAPLSAIRIGGSYVVGGLLPLLPYMLIPNARVALWWSTGVTFIALLAFGAIKGAFTGVPVVRSAINTAVIGGVAAAAAYFFARLVA